MIVHAFVDLRILMFPAEALQPQPVAAGADWS
jgi:hypothetical protein